MSSSEIRLEDAGASLTLGWREWVALPELGVPAIKAKVDTGARTSALHTFGIEPYRKQGVQRVRFSLHPMQRTTAGAVVCDAVVHDRRSVRDSGGHSETRWVITTQLKLAGRTIHPEVTLTNRDGMLFRMLLGRTALQELAAMVDPARSYLTGRPTRSSQPKGPQAIRQ